MKDAFERRALLLHLGEVIQAVSRLLKYGDTRKTVHELLAANDSLGSFRLLTQISRHMMPTEFAQRAADAFLTWPQDLLEFELDREALASAVQRNLYAGNPAGWRAYVADMRREVVWFGVGLSPAQSAEDARADSMAEESGVQLASEVSSVADVERTDGQAAVARDSVETSDRIYPSWPWKAVV
ncbi:hypothetical protein [Paraburkholderia sp. BL10I2N1]|uniref:hypothetical protein n=1 Tax=Paraburkholderia sp. BL10I2N1 TaxID=1938796 RepID=UPI00105D67FD|nr:hypothetical protein [Paraburkholderia sp. BL10I2N1]TDN62893.1 hypothetical protein B0G77_6486 [Paraburkholderia sp. BL10I2N1]